MTSLFSHSSKMVCSFRHHEISRSSLVSHSLTDTFSGMFSGGRFGGLYTSQARAKKEIDVTLQTIEAAKKT